MMENLINSKEVGLELDKTLKLVPVKNGTGTIGPSRKKTHLMIPKH